jgi:hypothetical protein
MLYYRPELVSFAVTGGVTNHSARLVAASLAGPGVDKHVENP